jgi:N-formylglutamate amidohydrolase
MNIMIKQMMEKPFSIISKGKPAIPVIAHIPHGSTFIPLDVRHSLLLSDEDLKKELILMTDSYTPELFAGIVASGGLALVNNFSRLVVDPERFESDEKEKMSSKGMGAIYTRTACQLMLRKEPSAKEREKLLSTYFRPYHKALRKEVQKMLDQFGRCLIIDCHSFPSKPLPYELDQSIDRPDICIGTDPFHTPHGLIALICSFCETNEVKVAIDKPFAGTYVPLMYLGKDKRISSIMIEVNRSLYMNEETGDRLSQFSQTKWMIDSLIKEIIGFEVMQEGE